VKENWKIDNPLNCPIVRSLNLIGGKWKPMILHMLSGGTLRFGELKKNMPPISQKVLTQQLRELEIDGIVERKAYSESPPKVEYFLSEKGSTLTPVLDSLYEWGEKQLKGSE
jgi:DNA-binding HxlR family transcriptional regulator